MTSLSRKEIVARFDKAVELAEAYNSSSRSIKRFYPITEYRRGKLDTIGLYDYKTKKYILGDILSYNIAEVLEEIETLVNNA